MSKKATIWVIEQGSYSDYRVVGVFSRESNARLIADRINLSRPYDEAAVAEWPLDPGVNEINQGLHRYVVQMRKDGSVEKVARVEFDAYEIADEFREWPREEAPAYRGTGLPNLLAANVWAEDDKHAIKIANEHRIQMLALGQWKGKL